MDAPTDRNYPNCRRTFVYAQVQGILTSMQAQPHLIDPYARHELNLDLRIYELLRVAIDIMKRGIIEDETCASKSAKLQNSAFYLRRRKS